MGYENSAGADSTETDYTGKKPNSKGSLKTDLQTVIGNKLSDKSGSGTNIKGYPKPF